MPAYRAAMGTVVLFAVAIAVGLFFELRGDGRCRQHIDVWAAREGGGRAASQATPSARHPTAAAPTSGPAGPNPPGTTRVPSENSRRAEASTDACAAWKNGAPHPNATEPDTTASWRSS